MDIFDITQDMSQDGFVLSFMTEVDQIINALQVQRVKRFKFFHAHKDENW